MDAVLSRFPLSALDAFNRAGTLPPVHVCPEARQCLYAIVEVSRGPMVEVVAAGLSRLKAKAEAAQRNVSYTRRGITVRAFACAMRGLLDPDALRAGLTSLSTVYGDALESARPRRVPR